MSLTLERFLIIVERLNFIAFQLIFWIFVQQYETLLLINTLTYTLNLN